MSNQNLTYIVCFIFILYILSPIGGCKKEYSFEGGNSAPDTTIIRDTTVIKDTAISGIIFPTCIGCNSIDTFSASIWSLKVGSSVLCGKVTRAVVSPDSSGMTFFGPSICSADSGLIITAYFLNEALRKDQSNITAERASLEYYDNTTLSDVLVSKKPNNFSVTIVSYNPQRGMTGTFNGWVVDKNGNVVKVDAGKFRIKF